MKLEIAKFLVMCIAILEWILLGYSIRQKDKICILASACCVIIFSFVFIFC